MKYFLKNSVFGLAYLVVMDMLALVVSYIQNQPVQIIVSIVAVLFYCFVTGFIFEKEGETALDVLHNNDMQRRRMVETGELVEIKTAPEYKPYKGFVIGLFVCVPLVVMLLLHLILGLFSGWTLNGAGVAATLLYFLFYTAYGACRGVETPLLFGEYYVLLYAAVIISVTLGVAYIIGAKKAQKKYDKIEQKRREIYGE